MKRAILAGLAAAALLAAWMALVEQPRTDARATAARVNAQIDARLHQVCAQLIARERARSDGTVTALR